MAINRRALFQGFGAAGAVAAALPTGLVARVFADTTVDVEKQLFFTAARRGRRHFCFLILDEDGIIRREIPLTARGHDATIHQPTGRGVVFARRPGTFAVSFDVHGNTPVLAFTTPADRHFYGHGVFSPDGNLLYATENDFESARGVIGIYDVQSGYKRIGEFESSGIGPHDLLMLPDNETLVVANGGIETHPDAGRAKLNVETMSPSLVFIDRQSGDLLTKHQLPANIHKLSIRHLTSDATGRVWFGCQWEGDVRDTPGLVGCAGRDGKIHIVSSVAPKSTALRGYIGSVAIDHSGRLLAASAPRAGRILFIDTETGRLAGETTIVDGCGVAPASNGGFLVSSGVGQLASADGSALLARTTHDGIAFDNHMISSPLRNTDLRG